MHRLSRLVIAVNIGLLTGLVSFIMLNDSVSQSPPFETTASSTPFMFSSTSDRINTLAFAGTPDLKTLAANTEPFITPGPEIACTGFSSFVLVAGQQVVLSSDRHLRSRVRESPNLQAMILGQIGAGEILTILDGPQCTSGYVWWKVQSATGLTGWTVEGDHSSNWLVTPTLVGTETVSTSIPAGSSQVQLLHTLSTGTETFTTSIAWSPDGTRLAAAGNDETTIRIWDWAQEQQVSVFGIHGESVTSVDWSPDGKLLASGINTQIRSSTEGALLREMYTGVNKRCWSVDWSPNGLLLAAGCEDGTIFIWDVETGEPLRVFYGHVLPVRSLAWSPSGLQIASGSFDGTIRIWDVITDEQRFMLTNNVPDCQVLMDGQIACGVESIAWSPEGDQLAFGGANGSVQLWHVESGDVETVGYHSDSNEIVGVAWSPGGQIIASTGGYARTIRLWDLTNSNLSQILEPEMMYRANGVAWSPDGKYLAVAGSSHPDINHGLVWIWGIP